LLGNTGVEVGKKAKKGKIGSEIRPKLTKTGKNQPKTGKVAPSNKDFDKFRDFWRVQIQVPNSHLWPPVLRCTYARSLNPKCGKNKLRFPGKIDDSGSQNGEYGRYEMALPSRLRNDFCAFEPWKRRLPFFDRTVHGMDLDGTILCVAGLRSGSGKMDPENTNP
jgi:hypothetical protein